MPKVVEEPSEEAIELWNSWFSLEETSIRKALETFEIDTDKRDKEGPAVDEDDVAPVAEGEPEPGIRYDYFNPRPRQLSILDTIERHFWRRKRACARLVCLKARRYGLTTFFLLLALERVLRVPGYHVALIAQDDDTAQEHFARVRDFYSQIPKGILKARGIDVVQDTHNRLVLRHPGNRTSRIRIATAQRRALGRGLRNNMLILTEFPQWRDSAKRDLTGILKTCQNMRGNAVIFESTAQGQEEFYRRFKRAEKRGSSYQAVFVASFENPNNRKAFEDAAQESEFIASIGLRKEYGAEDEIVLFRRLTVDLGWTPADAASYLNWRREEIDDECDGSVPYFKREEPNTPDEAFTGTGKPLFRKDIIEAWRDDARKREEGALTCRLSVREEKIVPVEEPLGDLAIFERPEPGVLYAFGADVASGIEVQADNKTEADFSQVTVKVARTRVTVARFHAHIPEGEFAAAAFYLACYYNGARGYIERQINSAGVTITRFEEMEFGEWVGASLLLSQKELVLTDHATQRKNWQFNTGFRTTQRTKPLLVERIRDLVRDTGVPDGEKVCPWDLLFIEEAMIFERVGRTGRMEARGGHDDAVISEGLALEACAKVLEDAPPEDSAEPENEDPWVRYLRHQQLPAARGDDVDVSDSPIEGMPDF